MKQLPKKIIDIIHKYRYDLAIFALIALASGVLFEYRDHFDVFGNREEFRQFIQGFGVLAPIVVIMTIVVEVIVAPLPGYVPAITAGFVFGPVLGSIYTFIGNIIGAAIVFAVARKFGKRIVERFMKKQRVEKYEKVISKHENYLLVLYFVPIAPLDIITAAFGLSDIGYRKFFTVSSIGFLIYSILSTNFGDYLAKLWF